MKKFEYYSFYGTHGDTTNEYLDELGKDGWEAYAVVPNGDTIVVYLKDTIVVYLKKEKP